MDSDADATIGADASGRLDARLRRTIDALVSTAARIAGVIFAACVILNFANVVGRYVFSSPIYWAEEITVQMIAWCIMLGACAVAARNDHLKVEILEKTLPPRLLRLHQAVTVIVFAAVCALVATEGVFLVGKLHAMDQRSIVAQVPMTVPYGALPIGFGLMILVCLARLYELIRGRDKAVLPEWRT